MLNNLNKLFVLTLSILVASALFTIAGEKEHHEYKKVKGTLVCLLPDYEGGTVKPVVAVKPCDGHEPHAHVILEKRDRVGHVYAVEGSEEAISKLEKLTDRKDVEVNGKLSGSPRGWVLTVE